MQFVDLLVLGKGFCGTFAVDEAISQGLSVAATTRSGANGTLPFLFDVKDQTFEAFKGLPSSQTVLITFPLDGPSAADMLVKGLASIQSSLPRLILLGSTGAWGSPAPESGPWMNRHSPISPELDPARISAEHALLDHGASVLHLAGLYGGERHPRNWVPRVAPTKAKLGEKTSLHLIHGMDVARASLALMKQFTPKQRWILTDERVYCWFDLVYDWGTAEHKQWVQEYMDEQGLQGLPRTPKALGRALSSRDFWKTFDLAPKCGLRGYLGECS